MEAPLALYRRYRPETFAEVIGQEHVTEPLQAALRNNRVSHAYLFSGPRGCGKTTSARILARALNCEQGPTPEPCGTCRSCQDLARGGGGSVDVIEIDAASHGGVDDARDLRERAFFAPVASRYKVYIIDEAHMVTTQGFNALLKLVEEPPPHLKFIFATTEPEKVIGTIRSRTHHYPFRLIPPRTLSSYLSELCEKEGVAIEPAALPLVVRAGGGSARDTLSVLDQLIGGAGPDGVTYRLAAGLLGYTPDSLLDEVIDAFAAGDGRVVFGVVDKVMETGQDPRRFTEDLLRRLRDLVIIAAVPDATSSGLVDVPADQAERLSAQAARFGRSDLSRAADIVAAGLTELRGATAPRLLLELICARVLLPGADDDGGLAARLDRLEKRWEIAGTTSAPAAPAAARPVPEPAAPTRVAPEPASPDLTAPPEPADESAPERPAPGQPDPGQPDPVEPAAEHRAAAPTSYEPAPEPPAAPAPEPPAEQPAARADATPQPTAPGALTLADVRRVWPDVIDRVRAIRMATWALVGQNAQAVGLEGNVLTLAFKTGPLRDQFVSQGHEAKLNEAFVALIGKEWKFEAIIDSGVAPDPRPGSGGSGSGQASADASAPSEPAPVERRAPAPEVVAAAREAITETRPPGPPPSDTADFVDDDVDPDDEVLDDDALGAEELLQRELGASVIEEIPHN